MRGEQDIYWDSYLLSVFEIKSRLSRTVLENIPAQFERIPEHNMEKVTLQFFFKFTFIVLLKKSLLSLTFRSIVLD